MNLKQGIFRIESSESETIIQAAELEGWDVFEIDGSKIEGRDSYFDYLRENFPMNPPLESNRSWDGLEDSLWGGIDDLTAKRVLIIWKDSSVMAKTVPDEYEDAVDTLVQMAETICEPKYTCGDPTEVCVILA